MTAEKTVHQTAHVLDLLAQGQDKFGWVKGLTVARITRETGLDAHDARKTLWNLQKRGYVKFNESHPRGSKSRDLTSIRLTPAGRALIKEGEAAKVEEEARTGSEPPNGLIRGIPRNNAPEGVWGERSEAQPTEAAILAVAAAAASSLPDESETFADAFPLIASIVRRSEKVQEASRLLEQAGMIDLATKVIVEGDIYSDLEREVVGLIATLRINLDSPELPGD